MNRLETYNYRPLNHHQQLIRLLHVLPGQHSEPIKADIQHASLSAIPAPLYETISYVWGNPAKTALIELSGKYLRVPHNTHAALQRMRLSDKPRMLWIDAISINQDDIHERCQQVALMGRIYSSSAANLIHLCDDDNIGAQVLRIIGRVDQEAKEATDGYKIFAATVRDGNTGDLRFSEQESDTNLDSSAVEYLLSLPWFR